MDGNLLPYTNFPLCFLYKILGNQKIWLEVDEWNGGIVQDTMGKSTFICLDIIIYLSLRISK